MSEPLGLTSLMFFRKAGYRGAIGFKNRHRVEVATIRLTATVSLSGVPKDATDKLQRGD